MGNAYQELVSIAAQQLSAESDGNLAYSFYASGNDLMISMKANAGGRTIEFGKPIRVTPDGRLLCDDSSLIYDLEGRVDKLRRALIEESLSVPGLSVEVPLIKNR